jgi:hypothetical protein
MGKQPDQQTFTLDPRRVVRVLRHEEASHGPETGKFYLEPAVEGEPI